MTYPRGQVSSVSREVKLASGSASRIVSGNAGQAPEVSIVIPSHRRPRMLAQAVESCLEQRAALSLEVIVVHDGPGRASRELLEQRFKAHLGKRLHYHEQPKIGGQHARNQGLSRATGRYVKFLDDDDYLHVGSLSRELWAVRECDADLSYGAIEDVDSRGRTKGLLDIAAGRDPFAALVSGTLTANPIRFLVRSELARRHPWSPHLPIRQDASFFLTLLRHARNSVAIPEVVAYRRQHRFDRRLSCASPRLANAVSLRILKSHLSGEWPAPLTREQQQALIQALWSCSRRVALSDPAEARATWSMLRDLSGKSFTPRRTGLGAAVFGHLDRWLGVRVVDELTLPVRRVVSRFGVT